MMKALPLISSVFAAGAAKADPGHLLGAVGHDHWVAGAAIGAAIAVGVWGAVKGRQRGDTKAEAEPAKDRQEA